MIYNECQNIWTTIESDLFNINLFFNVWSLPLSYSCHISSEFFSQAFARFVELFLFPFFF